MNFIELNRLFVPIKKDQEPDFDFGRVWGQRADGWLDWNDLITMHRVVLLAEAGSGKSEEFRNRAAKLSSQGKAAFFLAIEELADSGFKESLGGSELGIFENWRTGSEEAFFFLDSVDEARLNGKRFNSALKNLSRDLVRDYNRSHLFISCRVTDWKGVEDQKVT